MNFYKKKKTARVAQVDAQLLKRYKIKKKLPIAIRTIII